MIDLGMHEIQVLNSILKDFNSVLKNKTIPKEIEDDVQETDIQELIQRISALQRINAYFIMSLYALIDFYTKGLIIELTSIISQERAYKYSQKMPKASKNPVNAIKLVINELDLIYPDTRKTLDEIIKTKQWQIHKEAFNNLKEIRHTTAHQIPIISYKTLCENFPYYQEAVLKQLGELRGEFKNMQFPSFWEKSIDTFVNSKNLDVKYRQLTNLDIIDPIVTQRLQWALSTNRISREIGSLTLIALIRNTDVHKPEIDETYLYFPEYKRLVSTLLYTYLLVLKEKDGDIF